MANEMMELLGQVTDEKSFVRFLGILAAQAEASTHDCERSYRDCVPEEHWQTRSTAKFLRSAEEWGGGDFADGAHGGEPILRRVATMLYVAKYLRSDDRPR